MIEDMEKGNRILLLGNGGHCRSVIDSIIASNQYEQIGIVVEPNSKELNEDYVVGTDNDLQSLFKQGWDNAFVTVGSVGNTIVREKLYEKIKEIGFIIPNVIDPTAVISKNAKLGEGVFVGKKAVINANSQIGNCAIINTGAIIEHDCVIGEFVHLSTGALLCGEVQIGSNSHIGAGTVIRQQINVGCKSLIGIGSVVVKDITDNVVAYGNPCCAHYNT